MNSYQFQYDLETTELDILLSLRKHSMIYYSVFYRYLEYIKAFELSEMVLRPFQIVQKLW